ncbi:MAG: hypothetical protein O4861_08975 [Trichodesmium sp. St16_bin4-tuft]|nr:hypothetical protein [Trichodesmium sp. St5_bin8]MDE5098457.1 hypothetical protein [Trichodesmium sp. St16_bin4-tuft]MDE5102683.1 hypothetical protein [Trichodesmium sp. St19_bin2]
MDSEDDFGGKPKTFHLDGDPPEKIEKISKKEKTKSITILESEGGFGGTPKTIYGYSPKDRNGVNSTRKPKKKKKKQGKSLRAVLIEPL